jgi:hypothetical protein
MPIQEVKHYQINQRYKIQFEVGATKGVIGWKIEANGDSLGDVELDAKLLKEYAEKVATIPAVANG